MHVFITDANDTRLDPYRNIRERDLIRNHRQFIAEGKSVLAVLANQTNRFSVHSVLVLENRLGSIETILLQLDASIPVYVVTRQIIDAVAGFPMHRGILAIADRPDWCDRTPTPNDTENWRVIVAVSEIANHDNMGALFRNAAALGADAILIDAQSCDPFYRKAVRVSVGGVLTVPFHIFDSTLAVADWLAENDFEIAAFTPSASKNLKDWKPHKRTALLFGAEGPGLDNAILARQDITPLCIEMAGSFDSLNVATTAAIALHHVQAQRG